MEVMNTKKTNALLLSLSICLLLLSCEDNNKDVLNLDADMLKQTSWSGKLIESYNAGKEIHYSDFGIIFHTTNNGQFDLKRETDIEPRITRFEYTVEGKILFFKGNIELSGYWLLIEKSKDKMVLEQSSGGEYSYKATLVLTRSH